MKKPKQKDNNISAPRYIALMGSTGSIGTQTLDVVRQFPEKFRRAALTACDNWQLLATQAREFHPRMVVIRNEQHLDALKEALSDAGIEVLAGEEGLLAAAILPEADIVVGALVGYSGLPSVVAALEADKTVALANKETLVVGGELIDAIVRRRGKRIIPVDSEHSAIFQCLFGETPESVGKIVLTASGGPFRTFTKEQLKKVTVEQALSHPNWNMGAKVTIDSATMMNKGFEMIEARWLFSKSPDDIEVVVHPESIVHSMVEFVDGSVKAQLGCPDMHLPITVALGYPERLPLNEKGLASTLDLTAIGRLSFEDPDLLRFPLLGVAYSAAKAGGLVPALMNAANEVAVDAFLNRRIGFTDINSIVMDTVRELKGEFRNEPVTLESIAAAHNVGMEFAKSGVRRISN